MELTASQRDNLIIELKTHGEYLTRNFKNEQSVLTGRERLALGFGLRALAQIMEETKK
jgi:hypothetical protein